MKELLTKSPIEIKDKPKGSRRSFLKGILPAVVGGVAGVASGKLEAHQPQTDYSTDITKLNKGQADVSDHLLFVNERVTKLGTIVVIHDRELKILRDKK